MHKKKGFVGKTIIHVIICTILLGGTNTVFAACVESPTGTYTCSGDLTAQTLSAASPATYKLVVNQTDGSIDYLLVTNQGSGETSITTSGDITGADVGNSYGISLDQQGNGDVTVEQSGGYISGNNRGIWVNQSGNGDVEVTQQAAGTIESGSSDGIRVYQYNTGSTLLTTGGTITGGGGLRVDQWDDGDVTIKQTAGTITSTLWDAIAVRKYSGSGTVSITTASDVIADDRAILLLLQSDGDVTITQTAGTITGKTDDAIYVDHDGTGTIKISLAGKLTGDSAAIDAKSSGGAISIDLSGTVSNISGLTSDLIIETTGGATQLNLNDGSSTTGVITLSDRTDTLNWNGGSFNGTFESNAGEDTANIYCSGIDGSQVLDGGTDTDTVNFYGVISGVTGTSMINWEKINICSGSITSVADYLEAKEVQILDGGTLALDTGVTSIEIRGNLTNSGTINLNKGNSSTGDNLIVTGNYTANDNAIVFDVDFSTSTSDYMSVGGDLSGTGCVEINDFKSTANNSSDEITLIEVTGTDTGTFSLVSANQYNGQSNLGRFENSPFIWKLKQSGENWILGYVYDVPEEPESPGKTVISEIPAYTSLPTFSYEIVINKLDTLHQRLGELRRHGKGTGFNPDAIPQTGMESPPFDVHKLNGWVRTIYSGFDFDADKSFALSGNFGITELGFDHKLAVDNNTDFYIGAYGSYVDGHFDNDGSGNQYGSLYPADADIDGWSAGIYGTWFAANGTYMDMVFDYMVLDADIEAVDHYTTQGTVLAGSIEMGRSFFVHPMLLIEPQIQFKIAHVDWDDFHDGNNVVEFMDHVYVTGRAGVRSEYTIIRKSGAQFKPWLYIGIQDEFSSAPCMEYVDYSFSSHQYGTTGNIQAGLTADITNNIRFYGDAGYTTDLDDYDAWRVNLGLRVLW